MKIYWILFVAALACALGAEKIDEAVQADQKLKKVLLVIGTGVGLICMVPILAHILNYSLLAGQRKNGVHRKSIHSIFVCILSDKWEFMPEKLFNGFSEHHIKLSVFHTLFFQLESIFRANEPNRGSRLIGYVTHNSKGGVQLF